MYKNKKFKNFKDIDTYIKSNPVDYILLKLINKDIYFKFGKICVVELDITKTIHYNFKYMQNNELVIHELFWESKENACWCWEEKEKLEKLGLKDIGITELKFNTYIFECVLY